MVSPGNLSIVEAMFGGDRYYVAEANKDRGMENRNDREAAILEQSFEHIEAFVGCRRPSNRSLFHREWHELSLKPITT